MESIEYVVSASLIVLAFFLGLFSEPISEYFKRKRRKKNMAIVLASEITIIQSQSADGITLHEGDLKDVEELVRNPINAPNLTINDSDFPTSLHDAFVDDLSLADANLVSLITDLYVAIGRAQNMKERNRESSTDYSSFGASASCREPMGSDLILLQGKGRSSICYAKAYVKYLHTIQQLANETLQELGKIAVYKPTRKVIDAFGETLTEEFGTFPKS